MGEIGNLKVWVRAFLKGAKFCNQALSFDGIFKGGGFDKLTKNAKILKMKGGAPLFGDSADVVVTLRKGCG